MSNSSFLPSHEANLHPVSRPLGVQWKPLGDFLHGMNKDDKTNGMSRRRFSVDNRLTRINEKPKVDGVQASTCRRGSVGEVNMRGRRGSLADSLLLSLRATPSLSPQEEPDEEECILLQIQPACKEKQMKHRVRDFVRKVMRNSERPDGTYVIDLNSSFDAFRRALSIIPSDYSDAFEEQERVKIGEGANGQVFSFRGLEDKCYAVKIFHQ
ncbi:hypothetical protein DSO57_1019485 [Entomophthora muscae]|uniref:Uncharacterized protein n=1 Tax=Entomophthora muscae TaxID=34485 RepID=A0ACC2U2F2_9FUNG|nr:hypothetical protein DSO57_1019485 [Entomophthora muscae]